MKSAICRQTGLFLIVAAICAGGCGLTPADRVDLYGRQLERLETMLADSDAKVAAIQAALAEGLELLTDPNTIAEDQRQQIEEKVSKIRETLLAALEYKGRLTAWIDQTQAAIADAKAGGGIDIGEELRLIGEGVTSGGGAVGGPVGVWAGIVGLGISLAGNVLQKRTNVTLTKTAGAIVQGIEATPADAAEQAKAKIEDRMKKAGIYDAGNAIVDRIKGVSA